MKKVYKTPALEISEIMASAILQSSTLSGNGKSIINGATTSSQVIFDGTSSAGEDEEGGAKASFFNFD